MHYTYLSLFMHLQIKSERRESNDNDNKENIFTPNNCSVNCTQSTNSKVNDDINIDIGGVLVDFTRYSRCSRENFRKFTSDLLRAVFSREILATSSLTEKISNIQKAADPNYKGKAKLDKVRSNKSLCNINFWIFK
ncbi:uncharacterized protein LOC120358268 [Solenopsis invicta]|uniref:uncharacterized protein LOC120358268 n=1 Tax=Solenopsis invicta TaxID=13686 RepID=UPI00193E3FA3|nr:uncharacterized protein LOC120358268 [Solenopsis invicta]